MVKSAYSSAELYQAIGDYEAELEMLTTAIESGTQENAARNRRAFIDLSRGTGDLAREDLKTIALSPNVTGFELSRLIPRLRDIDKKEWLSTIQRSPALRRLKEQELHRVVDALMFDRRGSALAASLLREKPKTSLARSNLNCPELAPVNATRLSSSLLRINPQPSGPRA